MDNRLNETARASLLPTPATKSSRSYPVVGPETTIGRNPTNSIQLNHPEVSRDHAVIACGDGKYVLTDLASRNGTYVNNKRISQAVLKNSDKVSFGKRAFMFFIEADQPESSRADTDVTSVVGDTVTICEEGPDLSQLSSNNAESAVTKFFEHLTSDDEDDPPTLQAHERLAYIYQLNEDLRTPCDLEEMLEKGLEVIFEVLPSANRAAAMLRSNPAESLAVRAVKYREPDPQDAVMSVSRTVLRQVVEDQLAVVSPNVHDDERFEDTESFAGDDINSFLCVPLIQDELVIGAIYLDSNDQLNPFTQNDMEFAAAAASELALSIESCRLPREEQPREKTGGDELTLTHLAHSIKNLSALHRNAVDKMEDQVKKTEDENLKRSWQLVRQGFDRIAELSTDMLDYSQISADDVRPIDVNAVVTALYQQLSDSLADEGIEIDLQLDEELPAWEMNETLLHRAILSLVVNARDALKGRKNGRIRISTEVDHTARLIIRVKDNGCGIGKGMLKDIFTLFYTTKGKDGNGVGLSMAKKFVESMGGKISVISHVGVGSVFGLAFPRSAGTPEK